MSERKRALAAGFLVLFAFVAGAGEVQQPAPNGAVWKVTQQVFNDTPYRMRVLSATLTELTDWERPPAGEIAPNGKDVHAFSNVAPGHGLAGHVV